MTDCVIHLHRLVRIVAAVSYRIGCRCCNFNCQYSNTHGPWRDYITGTRDAGRRGRKVEKQRERERVDDDMINEDEHIACVCVSCELHLRKTCFL